MFGRKLVWAEIRARTRFCQGDTRARLFLFAELGGVRDCINTPVRKWTSVRGCAPVRVSVRPYV